MSQRMYWLTAAIAWPVAVALLVVGVLTATPWVGWLGLDVELGWCAYAFFRAGWRSARRDTVHCATCSRLVV